MIRYKNNASSALASGIANNSTTLTVTTSTGSLFPTLSGSDVFFVTLSNGTNMEIVKVTQRVNDTFTIVRAQEETTAHSFNSGDKVELLITARFDGRFKRQ